MNEIIERIKQESFTKIKSILIDMAEQGKTPKEIVAFFNDYVRAKLTEYYNKQKEPTRIGSHISSMIANLRDANTSKAEIILAGLFEEHGISYKYQYQVGPYKADFLIGENILLELDGPIHENDIHKQIDKRRDKYFRRMGYQVIHVPLKLLAIDPHLLVRTIKEEILDEAELAP